MSSTDTASAPAVNTAEIQRGRPFAPGQSGNPSGCPKGSRNRVTQAVEALIDGNASMLRALLGTLVPSRRHRTVEFELPKIETAADAVTASAAVLAACARGDLSPGEAREIMGLIATHVQAMGAAALEARQTAAQARQGQVFTEAALQTLTDEELCAAIADLRRRLPGQSDDA